MSDVKCFGIDCYIKHKCEHYTADDGINQLYSQLCTGNHMVNKFDFIPNPVILEIIKNKKKGK